MGTSSYDDATINGEKIGLASNTIRIVNSKETTLFGYSLVFTSKNGIEVKVENQLLKCNNLAFGADESNLNKTFRFYSDLTEKGIKFKELYYQLDLSSCGKLKLESHMFESNSKVSFSLTGTAISSETGGYEFWNHNFVINKNGFKNFYVESGIVDGKEFSNEYCSFNFKEYGTDSINVLTCKKFLETTVRRNC